LLLIAPQSFAAFDFAEHRVDPAVARDTHRSQLGMRAGQFGARADRDDEPALGDAVERGQGVRELQRVTK